MANIGFSLRSAFGLIPKTDKIESINKALTDELEKLHSYAESDELKEYLELKKLIESEEFNNKKKEILNLNFKSTEQYQKEIKYIKLKKDKKITNFFKVSDSQELSRFIETESSEELKTYLELKEYLSSSQHQQIIKEFEQGLLTERNKEKELKKLEKSSNIKTYFKALNSPKLVNYKNIEGSTELDEYNELKEFTVSQNLIELKKALAEQLISEKNKPKELKNLKKAPEVKSYYKISAKEETEKPSVIIELENLENYINSNEYKQKLSELDYKNTEEFKKEQKFKVLQKSKNIKDYFKFIESPLFKHYNSFKDSSDLKYFEELKAYIASPDHQNALKNYNYKESEEFQKEVSFQNLKKNKAILSWMKYQKSKSYILFKEIENSEVLSEYQELDILINSAEFIEFKSYMLDKDKWKKTEEFEKERRFEELKKSEDIVWYYKVKDSNKFDELKAWKITFEDDFTSGKIEEDKWMNSFFWGKMLLNDRYVIAGDKQYYTDNKNFELNGTSLKIVTKREKTKGKVWHPTHGFLTQEFDYTSGMLSTAHSFRQLYGRIEAKIKLNADYPIYQAFWLKGEKILPEIDIFKFNMDKKNRFQMTNFWGDPNNIKASNKVLEKLNGSIFTKDYFIYTLDWEENKLTWKINGIEVFSTANGIPNEPLYLMLSAGIQKETSQDLGNSAFEIDWVRCYQKE